jgi:hypothetical protein
MKKFALQKCGAASGRQRRVFFVPNKDTFVCICLSPSDSLFRTPATMAFNQPLEADRVDNLSLLSTLSRAPVIGALFWILGGDKAKEEEELQRQQRQKIAFEEVTTNEIIESPATILRPCLKRVSSISNHTGWKKGGAPSMLGSEISDVGEESACVGVLNSQFSSLCRAAPKKELSWSDEQGKDLIRYENEVSSQLESRPWWFCLAGTCCRVEILRSHGLS